MIEPAFLTTNVILAYGAYALGTASPGPSNLAVMATAMHQGRRAALVVALGVVCGSALWGVLAAFGLGALLAGYSRSLVVMKVLGGLYLLWLAFKSARSACRSSRPTLQVASKRSTARGLFLRGAALHLTNPKAIFVWLSIVALALPPGAEGNQALRIVAGCIPIGVVVFCSYALVFSTAAARRVYQRTRRWFEGALAVLFGYAGLRMLASRAAL
ncbi:LysE family transporter [Luteimonas sp. 3794]|uniref:LysE family translocator n=1 Tax=Luteimonas sp. 3794 TaxID=2817730 RepID=UPI00285F54EE|nr:LysE family transporter [Luteimonas sp. 3794]MDR6992723.1 threonine/homoserine/homoserine lactone efflux protein [Luteimonas sp. 3794]